MILRIPNTEILDLERVIISIGNEFSNKQALILSEDDLKCHLFTQLYNQYYCKSYWTMDNGILGCPIHTEIRFYNAQDKLTFIPDITILNPENLSIKKRIQEYGLPSKQFEFGGDAVVFELKFCKNKNGISKYNIESYKKDIEKIKEIQSINRNKGNKIFGFFVIFNKTASYIPNFENFLRSEDYNSNQLKIIYASGNIVFR